MRGELLPVVKQYVIPQRELPRRVVNELPRGGQVGHDLARIQVAHHQVVKQMVHGNDPDSQDMVMRIERSDVTGKS